MRLGIHAALGVRRTLLTASLLLGVIPGCSSEPVTVPSEAHADAIEGELSSVSVLASDGRSSMLYSLRSSDESRSIALSFVDDPELPSGTRLRVWGAAGADGTFVATRHEVIEASAVASRSQALIGQPSVTRRVAWVQMDVNGEGVTQTKADASRLIFDQNAGPLFGTRQGDKSVAQYYDENSYGQLKLTGQVEGPIPFNGTACNNFEPLARDVIGKVTALGRTYDHYYLYWGSQQNCGPGWGEQGTKNKPGRSVWLNKDGTFCTATGQEIGHNFGMMHASTMRCSGATLANSTSSCTSDEYGNPMTVMGSGCKHLNAVEKWYSGFFKGCNAVRIKSSATVTLFPIEIPCNGIQAIQVAFPSGAPTRTTTTSQSGGAVTLKYYYLELRGGQGMDTGMKTGVYVHVAPDVPAPSANGARTFLLDMNPSTNAFDPMSVGQTFSDPAGGLSITLESADTNKASVRITIDGATAGNTCVDNSALSGSGPTSCTDGGTGGSGSGGSANGGGSSGGAANGGSANGGTTSSAGGAAAGGRVGAGGAVSAMGGSANGGASSGGRNSGGASAGGRVGNGGGSTGGSAGANAQGGSSNGGASNGGNVNAGGNSGGGNAGSNGNAGSGGNAGSAGSAGSNGGSGNSNGGAQGSGGNAPANGGINSSGGASGGSQSAQGGGSVGGGPVVAGSGNLAGSGSGGSAGSDSGCGCKIEKRSESGNSWASGFAFALATVGVARRRRRRAKSS